MKPSRCRRCGAEIIFLTEEPKDVRVGNNWPPVIVRSEPKPHPIDASPATGSNARIAIYKYPGDVPGGAVANIDRPFVFYYRRLEPQIVAMLAKTHEPPPLYSSHFDTCTKPDRPRDPGRR
jgi:hypothetical protein